MFPRLYRTTSVGAFALAMFCLAGLGKAVAADSVDYARDVLPILETYCVGCHSRDDSQGGFSMDSLDELLRGGDSGSAVTPGEPGSSRMLLMVSGKLEPVMPPDGAEGPNEEELAILAAWVEQGAKGADGDVPRRRTLRVPQIDPIDGVPHPITAIAGSDTLFAAARYGEVELTALDGSPIRKLPAQAGKVNSLSFNRAGDRLLIASGVTGLYGQAAVYDVSSGERILEIVGHDDLIQEARFSPDEARIATAGYDHKIMLWDARSGKLIRSFEGHNAAVYSLAFSPDGSVLVSGSADETVKVWSVESGARLDTMSQPEDEVFSVRVTDDGKHVAAVSGDNRLRVWRLVSLTQEKINPLRASRFVDESPPVRLAITPDGSTAVVVADSGNIKLVETETWNPVGTLPPLDEPPADMMITADGSQVVVSLLSGEVVRRALKVSDAAPPQVSRSTSASDRPAELEMTGILVDTGSLATLDESELRKAAQPDAAGKHPPVRLPRGAEVTGSIAEPGEEDWYAFTANRDELWVVETDTSGLDSPIDTVIEIRDADAEPILRTRLQAVRDSYFTFRGKDSRQTGDFRLFAWEEMNVGDYLYAAGEVTRLWLYPRGADSGYDVFPGRGNRWTYFGTTASVHALGEPAYIVRPLEHDEPPAANGLPVFEIPYLNDDEPTQTRGRDSYLLFRAPADGNYLVRVRDTRGEGGKAYRYKLRVRPAEPGYVPRVTPISAELLRGSGREVMLFVDRRDGFDGEVVFEIDDLPPGVNSSFPVTVEPGQHYALANVWVDADAEGWEGEIRPAVRAHAFIADRRIERSAGDCGALKIADRGRFTLQIFADDKSPPLSADSVVQIRRGETISLIVRADRQEGFTAEIPVGKELAGRNLPFGAYVDNIGLNGLLIRENESERRFFITADEVTALGKRQFFLTGELDGNITAPAVTLEVLP